MECPLVYHRIWESKGFLESLWGFSVHLGLLAYSECEREPPERSGALRLLWCIQSLRSSSLFFSTFFFLMKWLVFTLHDDDCSLLPTSSKSQRIWNSCGIAGTPGYLKEIGCPWAQTESHQPRTVNAISAPTAVHGTHSHSSIGITWSNKWKDRWGREQATSEPKPEKLKLKTGSSSWLWGTPYHGGYSE